jgi:prolyl oligopeptidase
MERRELRHKIKREHYPDTASAMNNLAAFYLEEGNPITQPEPLLVPAGKVRQRALGQEAAPDTEQTGVSIPRRRQVHGNGASLDSFSLAGGKLAANWLENVHSHIEILSDDGKLIRQLPLPGIGEASVPAGRWQSDVAFYAFSSLNQPNIIYRYSMSSGSQSVWFQQKEPFDPSAVEVKQVWYNSQDGTRVPTFLAYQTGIKLDGSHPTLLTGYGGFNLNMLPTASNTSLAWLEMGGVFALPNLRGGGEFGEKWHDAGKLDKKQNVFDDFIVAAEYLIKQGYTSKDRLAIRGGSNGGLLVGAALTQRPNLFRAVVCSFPLLDMLRYDRFKVAKFWVPEYGTAQDPTQFPYIYKYSPYQHVEKGGKYPAVLLVSGDFDTRVDPCTPAKRPHCSKLRPLPAALFCCAMTPSRVTPLACRSISKSTK